MNLLIKSQPANQENAEEYASSKSGAAPATAVGAEKGATTGDASGCMVEQRATIDAELAEVLKRWPTLAAPIRLAIMALVRSGD